jgi:hypothetical protein
MVNNSRRRNRPRKQQRVMRRTQGLKSSNASTPFRIRTNRQILSIPSHSYRLKMRKSFRIYLNDNAGSPVSISWDVIKSAIQKELGLVTSSDVAYTIGIYSGHVYAQNASGAHLDVFINDNALFGAPLVAQFTDSCSNAGVISIEWVYPVRTRPFFGGTTPGVADVITVVPSKTNTGVAVDLDIEFTQVNVNSAFGRVST